MMKLHIDILCSLCYYLAIRLQDVVGDYFGFFPNRPFREGEVKWQSRRRTPAEAPGRTPAHPPRWVPGATPTSQLPGGWAGSEGRSSFCRLTIAGWGHSPVASPRGHHTPNTCGALIGTYIQLPQTQKPQACNMRAQR